jgi:hypothetical protein
MSDAQSMFAPKEIAKFNDPPAYAITRASDGSVTT